jgi:phenylalanyl-tRNA synthetase alpha subunit
MYPPCHPLTRHFPTRIETYFKDRAAKTGQSLECFDDFFPVVPTRNNFDDLLIPADHVSRSPIDTYYVDDANVLRTHTRCVRPCARPRASASAIKRRTPVPVMYGAPIGSFG